MDSIREGRRVVSCRTALALFAVAAMPWSAAWPQPRPLLDQYCAGCHNQKNATAGIALNGIDLANAGGNAAVLEKVLRKIRTGEMPPAGMPRPAAPVSAGFTKSLEDALDPAAAADPNPGRLAGRNTSPKPSVEDLPARRDGPGGGGRERNERASDDLPFDSRGGFALRY